MNYANIFTRVKAAVIDGIILIILMYLSTAMFNLFDYVPNYLRLTVFISLFILYEPILVSFFGASVGHFFSDIVVKRDNDNQKNIQLPIAIIRFVFKLFLGWVSLLTVNSNEKRKAIHDFVGGSVVLDYKSSK